jgi:hypothetical protein
MTPQKCAGINLNPSAIDLFRNEKGRLFILRLLASFLAQHRIGRDQLQARFLVLCPTNNWTFKWGCFIINHAPPNTHAGRV